MPVDRGIIDQQLTELGEGSRWWDVRELRDLPSVLHEGERIMAISRGKVARVRWLRRPWLIVVTDRRLLCLRSKDNASWRQFEVPGGQVVRVSLRVGPFRGRVLVGTGDRSYRLLVPRPDAHRLLMAISLFSNAGTRALSGFAPTRMVRQVIDHMLALPAVALDPGARRALPVPTPATDRLEERVEGLDERMDGLEDQVAALQDQVAFLEQLLRDRHDLPGPQEPA